MRGLNVRVITAAALAVASMPVTSTQVAIAPTEQTLVDERKVKNMRESVARGSLARRIRSRGPQAKPKKRPNRNHIGKRVRRKHRRAA